MTTSCYMKMVPQVRSRANDSSFGQTKKNRSPISRRSNTILVYALHRQNTISTLWRLVHQIGFNRAARMTFIYCEPEISHDINAVANMLGTKTVLFLFNHRNLRQRFKLLANRFNPRYIIAPYRCIRLLEEQK